MSTSQNAIFAAVLAAFGVTVPAPDFFGGMFLAIAFAFLVMAFTPPEGRKTYVLTLATAAACGVLATFLHQQMLAHWSLHFLMALAGALSRYIVDAFLSFGGALKATAATIPGRLADKFLGKGKGDV